MKWIAVTILCMFVAKANAQFSLSAGPSTIKAFGLNGMYPAFHLGLELSDDDTQTLYGRITFSTPKSSSLANGPTVIALNPSTNPYYYQLEAKEKFSYIAIEGGKRFYFGDGYDSGFSPYGGTNLQLIFNQVKMEYEEFDQSKYALETNSNDADGTIFSMFFGLQGGLKQTFYFGTIYFDIGLSYALFAVPSNSLANSSQNFRNLLFSFNLGFRKDFY